MQRGGVTNVWLPSSPLESQGYDCRKYSSSCHCCSWKRQMLAVLGLKMPRLRKSQLVHLLGDAWNYHPPRAWKFRKCQENPLPTSKQVLPIWASLRGGGNTWLSVRQKNLWIMNWQNSQQRNFFPHHWIKAFSYFQQLTLLANRLSQGKPMLIGRENCKCFEMLCGLGGKVQIWGGRHELLCVDTNKYFFPSSASGSHPVHCKFIFFKKKKKKNE